jgi:hypothetical protein
LNVYLESSAALRDVLEGEAANAIRSHLAAAEMVATSRLTLAEVDRALARLLHADPVAASRVSARQAAFHSDSELWAIEPVGEDVLARCSRGFPVEPVRTLDAIHLATIDRLASVLPDLAVLTTDERVRRNALALGYRVLP